MNGSTTINHLFGSSISKVHRFKLFNYKVIIKNCINPIFIVAIIFPLSLIFTGLTILLFRLPTNFFYMPLLTTMVTFNIFVLASGLAPTLVFIFRTLTLLFPPDLETKTSISCRWRALWFSSHFFIQNITLGQIYKDYTIKSRIY